jgi:type IV pilus assembly protein PilY1
VDLNGDGDKTDIVNGNAESMLGLSSYFAIDITDIDPANWTLLWEFSDENIPALELADGGLGFSTTGPAVVRINPATCQDAAGNPISNKEACNGEWFVAIPSGPTGPIDTATRQFMGRSDQKLKVFVIDARTGTYKAAIKTFNGAAIDYAFGGSAMDSVIDPDLDYQDDGFYLGYTNKVTTGGVDTWTNGGVIRIMTTENPDPTKWVGSKLIENIGAVTAAVSRMEDTNTNKLWTYFGTGRYFFKQFGVIDDAATQRRIYGVKDPCYRSPADEPSFTLGCGTTILEAALDDATTVPLPGDPEDPEGWFIDLDASGATYDAERVTTDPVASTIGATFFTTFKPTADICGYGGRSHLWAVKYNTGGTATSLLRGKALIQVSTGSIEEIDLKTAFDETAPGGSNPDSKDDRRSGEMIGKSPEGPGLILLTAPPPTEKVIHMREK